ncbi:hypothetical protein LSTR_LSTR011539 [Laodelphax striatellus]|uniref:Uncharacterized protein n=1 Tax=Laodelphax striatellus TaxID=195883 RepID=A0A482WF58_LAOST|nr:hypothetical protein LSTR_LSTR011539 [Laodelphax striatellus]
MFITISAQVKKYLSNPILMSLNGEITPAWDIPFPAVTICSENQFNPSLINLTEIVDRDNRTNDEVTPKIFDELSNIPYKYSLLSDRVWDMSEGYKELSFSENFLPWRTPGVSFDNSATFVLDFNKGDLEENCIPKGHGFWVVVHNPAEVPSPYQTVAYAETDMTTIYKLIPKQTTTADNLREWTPEERGCFYSHERKLKLYNTYSSHNCLYECEAEMIFKRCKCAATFISHYKISTPICGVHQIDCMQNVLENFSSQHHESNHFSSCNCLPACTEINYDIEYSDIPLDFEDPTSKRNNTEKGTTAVVTFHFKMNSVDNIQRVAIVTLSDFVANIGGLLGLFLGFSFLSFFEIIYFMTIRWVTNVWNKRNRQHSRERKAESLFEELKG